MFQKKKKKLLLTLNYQAAKTQNSSTLKHPYLNPDSPKFISSKLNRTWIVVK